MRDILEAIAAVRRHQPESFEAFNADELNRFFTLKQVEIIGEAVFKTTTEHKAAYPEVPWNSIEKIRHVFVHDYFEIEWPKLWDVVVNHLDPLRAQVERIITEFGDAELDSGERPSHD